MDNIVTGDVELVETFDGQVKIENTDSYKYLGFTISSTGDNMANIRQMKNKSIGIIKQIFNRLESLNLQKYYFECAIIFMNCMLRSSILYAADTYYDLKETELRELERIEEVFLRKLLKTSRGCPIAQLYLSVGQFPARFEIMKMRLMFMKYILNQDEESLIYKFFMLQLRQPTRGDWASTCQENLKTLEMNETFEEIRSLTLGQFQKIVKQKVLNAALEYLQNKQGKKGGEIIYSELKMSEYLQPNDTGLSIEEKRNLFSVLNRMVNISENFPTRQKQITCVCGLEENMQHIYSCKLLNSEKEELSYDYIFNGSLQQQIEVFKRFQINFEEREKLLDKSEQENHSHAIPSGEPLFSVRYRV